MTPLLDKKLTLSVDLFVGEAGPLEVKSIAVSLLDKIVKYCANVRRYDFFLSIIPLYSFVFPICRNRNKTEIPRCSEAV